MSWLFDVMKKIGTKMVHVCEGAVRYPVEWSQVETQLCVMACLNNMQCVEM